MSDYRFDVGKLVMCNLGERGWKLGRVIAMNYRESHWDVDEYAPYQVALEDDYSLIYVPLDDDRYCREALAEDLRIIGRSDALAEDVVVVDEVIKTPDIHNTLNCSKSEEYDFHNHRNGRCQCCNNCPELWTYAELYSEHYRCAARNNLTISRHREELGNHKLGDSVDLQPSGIIAGVGGFLQAPTLVRLPPGITFSDDGGLSGTIQFDPHRAEEYEVNFVAVSTNNWQDDAIGIIRYEISFKVVGNVPPDSYPLKEFKEKQSAARQEAGLLLKSLNRAWTMWEHGELDNRETCNQMCSDLDLLRILLEANPRLDNGKWWGNLGGYHMNVHKLLENTLFECELYLGYALTFGDNEVRFYAEQNLQGCYNKRLLEAARFMWTDGISAMLREDYDYAIEIFQLAAEKKSGWGWAVNYGDIWLSQAVATLIRAVSSNENSGGLAWLTEVDELVLKCIKRSEESGVFDSDGHPWASEIVDAVAAYRSLIANEEDPVNWLKNLKARSVYWCSQVLAGVAPFPPRPRERLHAVKELIQRLPEHNTV